MPTIRVAILDDHLSTIYGHQYALQRAEKVEVVGFAQYGEELEPLLSAKPVDVLLLDVSVATSRDNPNPYPILHLIPRLLERYPHLVVLIISMHGERAFVQSVMEVGASGYILKDDSEAIQKLPAIVQAVASGGIYLSPQARQMLVKRKTSPSEPVLTHRQLEILSLCAGYPDATTAEVARRLNVQHSTCRNLLSSAYLRLGVSNRASAIAKARQLGLLNR
jgi:DNA-binding NarL/FixJ family response regulator